MHLPDARTLFEDLVPLLAQQYRRQKHDRFFAYTSPTHFFCPSVPPGHEGNLPACCGPIALSELRCHGAPHTFFRSGEAIRATDCSRFSRQFNRCLIVPQSKRVSPPVLKVSIGNLLHCFRKRARKPVGSSPCFLHCKIQVFGKSHCIYL